MAALSTMDPGHGGQKLSIVLLAPIMEPMARGVRDDK